MPDWLWQSLLLDMAVENMQDRLLQFHGSCSEIVFCPSFRIKYPCTWICTACSYFSVLVTWLVVNNYTSYRDSNFGMSSCATIVPLKMCAGRKMCENSMGPLWILSVISPLSLLLLMFLVWIYSSSHKCHKHNHWVLGYKTKLDPFWVDGMLSW